MHRQFVRSSNIRSVGYDPITRVLEVEFHSGGIYQYRGVPASVYQGLMSAASKGGFFADFIKDRYPTLRIR